MSNDYEEVKHISVEGSRGRVVVNYIALSCPLVADIEKILLKQSFSSVYGSIVAQYGKTFGDTNNFCIPLLSVPSTQSIPIVHDCYGSSCMKLSRTLVAVPAYSTLMIKANLLKPILSSEDAVVVDGNDTPGEFWPSDYTSSSDFQMHNWSGPMTYNNAFTVFVSWIPLLYLRAAPTPLITTLTSLVPQIDDRLEGNVMLEVFSVFIGRENNVDLNVSGTIKIRSEYGFDVIFNRAESNPDKLSNGRKKLDITFPSGLIKAKTVFTFFTMLVELKDADRGFLIEEGSITFNMIRPSTDAKLFDRPIRTVITGENGYCAVHYAVYKSAERVNTKITLLYKGKRAVERVQVHGKVVAWADTVDNRTDYDHRIIFDKPFGTTYDPYKIEASKKRKRPSLAQVELSESSLVVPLDLIFKIGVNLFASSISDRGTRLSKPERLVGNFQLQVDKVEEVISGKDFDLHISYSRKI
ncbi:hypothetical protein RDABS01_016675 [Bienertia sinuspersici]